MGDDWKKSDDSIKSHNAVYKEYVERLKSQYQPTSAIENVLIDQMASAQWRMDRFARLEATLQLQPEQSQKELARIRRFASSARRSFQQALKTLNHLRKTRQGRRAKSSPTQPAFSQLDSTDFAPKA
jgi:hypothetical protein